MRMLVVEDDAVLRNQLCLALEAEGFAVDGVGDGEEAFFRGDTEPYDVIILDLGLPVRDGISVLKGWRANRISTPVIILSGRTGWSEKVDGLDAGADDYMCKPFHMAELLARVRAMIRRSSGRIEPVFEKGGVTFNPRTGRVERDGAPVQLTSQETSVLNYLVHNMGRLVSQTELVEHIYAYDDDRDSNTIAVFITRLRKKLGADLIRTVRGRGYIIDDAR